jgi:hypothetical protein
MKCFICNGEAGYYFTKDFDKGYLDSDKLFSLGKAEYFKCNDCGFVFSKTHGEMDKAKWEKLNLNFHKFYEDPDNLKVHNPPPYLQQAIFLKVLQENSIISNNILDWGGGYGTLAKILKKYYNLSVKVYDKYVQSDDVGYVNSEALKEVHFDTVFSSAVFEHVTKRGYLDEINNCVSENGCLIIHTVVCENIPKEPEWFYLGAVHCAFHTNKSMDILMKQWGYKSSIYCPLAKCWVFLKKDDVLLEKLICDINNEFQTQYLFYKKGFMDYWK